ncbi:MULTISPECIES: ribosome hibernation-promoting factor, HPF/YfiA family [Cellvibrio]|jgi:putative sigma-54 modulation protein|uniref:Ribosome hibernation promoting factor n=1 Tax=Cellvibrio fibrivorans TaxID=126350 RepID=A0ABU1V338_9GAMM|nr:ribosome-associated translation inhibitor RaiA [Cellvibrio fibrivorans]MDR7091792.1 putative sigma-54 modulation protein [Cellvibrio fibrivorans]
MQINISGRHVEVTDSMKEYVTSKIERLTHHHDRITSTNVILSVDKLIQKAEATIHVSGKDVFAEATHEDLYAAIDALADKLDRQLIKHKEKMRSHR